MEGAFEYALGLNVAWPIPGTHIPNQFAVQVIGAGAKLEAAAFVNHAIIVGKNIFALISTCHGSYGHELSISSLSPIRLL